MGQISDSMRQEAVGDVAESIERLIVTECQCGGDSLGDEGWGRVAALCRVMSSALAEAAARCEDIQDASDTRRRAWTEDEDGRYSGGTPRETPLPF